MAVMLLGYDVESAALGEVLARYGETPNADRHRLALDPETTEVALTALEGLHAALGVRGTLFVCGRTLLYSLGALRSAVGSGLFDVQQHTYSHVAFRAVDYAPAPGRRVRIPSSPVVALREEVVFTSDLIRRHLGCDCVGLRTPFGYSSGLRGRPDLLKILHDAGIRFVSSYGRDRRGGNPTPWVQPFWYDEDGYAGILELPYQSWIDVMWFDQHGYDTGHRYAATLRDAIDEAVAENFVYGVCFHEWMLLTEAGTDWLRDVISYALARGVDVLTYSEYWKRLGTR